MSHKEEEGETVTIKTELEPAATELPPPPEPGDDDPDEPDPLSSSATSTTTEINGSNRKKVVSGLEKSNPLLADYINLTRGSKHAKELQFFLSRNNSGEFLSIRNKRPDIFLQFKSNLNLIVRTKGPDLLCTLYTYRQQVFKGMVLKNFSQSTCQLDPLALPAVEYLLRELERDKYRVCSGAFTESQSDDVVLNNELIRTLYIEQFDESVVYRSRDCFTLIPSSVGAVGSGNASRGISACDSCIKLKVELANNMASPEKGMLGLASLVEVCMDSDNEEADESQNSQSTPSNKENEADLVDLDKAFPSLTRRSQLRKVKTTRVSYKKLIISAILSSPINMLKLTEIYDWITERYPMFKENKTGFQNSIRHNLSLNKVFVKVPTMSQEKGAYWTVDPAELKLKSNNWNQNDTEAQAKNFKIRIPRLHKASSASPVRERPARVKPVKVKPLVNPPFRRNLNISATRFVAIAPRPPPPATQTTIHLPGQETKKEEETATADAADSQDSDATLTASSAGEEGDKQVDVSGVDRLVIKENDEAAKLLPQNLKDRLKQGLPIILRPVDPLSASITNPSITTTTIISQPLPVIKPSSVVSLSPIIKPIVTPKKKDDTNLVMPNKQPQNKTSIGSSEKTVIAHSIGKNLKEKFTSNGKDGNASVGSNEFPKPPFSYKELCMISIFYSPEKAMSLTEIYNHIKLWFPYYRQGSIGPTWMNSIRHNLSLNHVFKKIDAHPTKGGPMWTFNMNDDGWKKLIVCNKWFETPVDADLFEHMAKNCPQFQQIVYSKRSMFKTVPITVKTTDDAPNNLGNDEESGNPAKRVKLEVVEEVEPEDPLNIKMETNTTLVRENGTDDDEEEEEVNGEDSDSNAAKSSRGAESSADDEEEIEEDIEDDFEEDMDDDDEQDPLQ